MFYQVHDYHAVLCCYRWEISGQPNAFYIQAFGDLLGLPTSVGIYGFTNLILERPSSNHSGRIYVCATAVQGGNLIATNTTVTAPRKFLWIALYIIVELF